MSTNHSNVEAVTVSLSLAHIDLRQAILRARAPDRDPGEVEGDVLTCARGFRRVVPVGRPGRRLVVRPLHFLRASSFGAFRIVNHPGSEFSVSMDGGLSTLGGCTWGLCNWRQRFV
jgi:hypothetical protein